jgi:hypothetical protein
MDGKMGIKIVSLQPNAQVLKTTIDHSYHCRPYCSQIEGDTVQLFYFLVYF